MGELSRTAPTAINIELKENLALAKFFILFRRKERKGRKCETWQEWSKLSENISPFFAGVSS
jgi:hypothetical protein